MNQAATAYEAARRDAEQHGVAGERATSQAQRAFVLAFTDPRRADDELESAQQLLNGLDLRATTLTTQIAALVRDAGTTPDVEDRARALQAEAAAAGIVAAQAMAHLAECFHHAVRNDHTRAGAAISRLRDLTRDHYTYYVDIAQFMADVPLDQVSGTRWLDSEQHTRDRWRSLVTARQAHHSGR
ncbi:hypothetical protein ACFC34_37635 [Streptomyces sp. NPDC056053]|uniref:hypothetical protein n=1 Tax=Streptomyces sp. NPDC056053 TaxID=3345696 RepID=UPI0035DF83F3